MKKSIVLVCLLLVLGSAGVALAGQEQPTLTRGDAVEWIVAWLGSLVPMTETHRVDGPAGADSKPLQPVASSTESGADDDGEDSIPDLGPLGEPVG